MKLKAWRIVKADRVAGAFTGEGARLRGGRWNSQGVRVVYTASSISLAVLELLVHLQNPDILDHYRIIQVEFDHSLVSNVDVKRLPRRWRTYPSPARLQAIGDDWAISMTSAALAVPSAIIPAERNYLLNPVHPDFAHIKREKPERFVFDRRLLK